jgi:hypothetical protein
MTKPHDSGITSLDPTSPIIHFAVFYYQCTLHKTHILGMVMDITHLSVAWNKVQVVILLEKLIL